MVRGAGGREDVWLTSLTGADASQFTFGPPSEGSPTWLAGGKSIVYDAVRDPDRQFRVYQSDLEARSERPLVDVGSAHVQDASQDGRFLVYQVTLRVPDGGGIWVLPLFGDKKPYRFQTPVAMKVEGHAQVSPNGQWIAYTSDELGRDEVFVETFPTPGGKRRVSGNGGVQPRWRRDGRELFYFASDQTLMAVPITNSKTLEMGRPAPLFRANVPFQGPTAGGINYDVSPNGQRFLIPDLPSEAAPPITVVLNWTAALKSQ
jgi:Tol biopolymer transport system component